MNAPSGPILDCLLVRLFFLFLLILNMKVSNLISFFSIIDTLLMGIPILLWISQYLFTYLFIYLFIQNKITLIIFIKKSFY